MSDTVEDPWQQFIRSVKPLANRADERKKEIPPRLHAVAVPERTLLYDLDLHGFTIEEAYQCLKRFFVTHEKAGSRRIRVITGKGLRGEGKIKNEIMLWLETPFFRKSIRETRWLNDGGVLEILLKRNKKNESGKNSSRY